MKLGNQKEDVGGVCGGVCVSLEQSSGDTPFSIDEEDESLKVHASQARNYFYRHIHYILR
jgi:hypothetical protein